MQHQLTPCGELLILELFGDVTVDTWMSIFDAAEHAYQSGGFDALLVDGRHLTTFDVSNVECQRLARGFVSFASKGAFYSSNPLTFGMMRVIHSYSNNELFLVCKTSDQAMAYLKDRSADYA